MDDPLGGQLLGYQRYEYPPDPPDGTAVRVAAWPLSIVAGETETDREVLIVTVTVVVAVSPNESVT